MIQLSIELSMFFWTVTIFFSFLLYYLLLFDWKFLDLDVELIAELASEVSRELSPQDIRLVVDMAKKMGPDLSAGEIQMISKMAPDLEQHDVEMITQVFINSSKFQLQQSYILLRYSRKGYFVVSNFAH